MQNFNRAPETNELISLFKLAAIGQIVTYSAMTEALGISKDDICTRFRSTTIRALYDEGYHFACIKNVGYLRLSADEAAAYHKDKLFTTTANLSKRTLRRNSTIEVSELSKDGLQNYAVSNAVASMQQSFVAANKQRALVAAIKDNEKDRQLKDSTSNEAIFAAMMKASA